MRIQAVWVIVALASAAGAGEIQPEQVVREPTRLDWEFAAGKGADLPTHYDSRRQRYQLFVPQGHKKSRGWPLVVFVSPGDDPLGWRAWEKPCEDAGWLFAAPYAAGNACPPGQRVRAVLDVIDDVRRQYRIDPDRTYLAGAGGGAEVAARIAFALPELFAGVVCQGGDVPLPRSAHLRHRLQDRLSLALVAAQDDAGRRAQERYLLPLYRGLGVRAKLWADAEAMPKVQQWLEADLKRRQDDARETALEAGETPKRRLLTGRGLEKAKKELNDPNRLHRAAALLEWVVARGASGESAVQAGEILEDLRKDDIRRRLLQRQEEADTRTVLAARARALESAGEWADSRRAWEDAARLADGDEREKAEAEARRLAELYRRSPYLGLTFAGPTLTVRAVAEDGPAEEAGVQPGDTVERFGAVRVAAPGDVREQLRRLSPGAEVSVRIRREGKPVTLTLRVGSPPGER